MKHNGNANLPSEIADRFTGPLGRFLKVEAATGVVLFLATCSALILSNSAWSTPFLTFWETPVGLHFGALDLSRSLRHWINDALMTFFFFVVALELKRELVLGELKNLRLAALSLAGALGGMLIPPLVYLAFMNGQSGMHGWGTVMATDTAFVIGCLALLGSRVPPHLRLFLLSLAIFDDVGAIVVVAIGYGHTLNWPMLVLVAVGLGVILGIRWIGIRSVPIYFLLGGGIWLGLDASGIHPTLAGVVLGLMTPTREWVSPERLRHIFERVLSYPSSPGSNSWGGDKTDRGNLRRAGIAAMESFSPVERLELMLHPWVGFVIMPIFAFANSGVILSEADVRHPVSLAIFAALVFGKPVGVLAMSWLAVRLGLAIRPLDLNWSLLAAGGLLTGIGFTMSLFIAGLAYTLPMLDAAKIGIFGASVVSATAGLLMLVLLTRKKQTESGLTPRRALPAA